MPNSRRIAFWISEKKLQKNKWDEFEQICHSRGYELVKLDLEKNLNMQGPFCAFLHKLTDIIALADEGHVKSTVIMKNIEAYISSHPNLVVIDPIANVRQLLNRYNTYSIIHATDLDRYGVFTPNFCQITAGTNVRTIAEQLTCARIAYPFICKSALGHGSRKAHRMMIIFNERGLQDVQPPAVAQAFVNHNAVIYKVFAMDEKYYFVERPSLKNFSACEHRSTIVFESSDISKATSQSTLSILDPEDAGMPRAKPDAKLLGKIAAVARKAFGIDLLGFDVVIENYTGKYAIVDVNYWPGYDGFPNVLHNLLGCVVDKLNRSRHDDFLKDRMECLNVI